MSAMHKKRKTTVFILIFILAVAAVAAALYFTNRSGSARDFYFKAESKNYNLYADKIKKDYADFAERQKPYLAADYKSRIELTAGVTSGDTKPFGINNAQGIFDVLNRCKLIVDTKHSPTKKTSLSEISLLLEKTPFADAEIFTDNRQMYFTVPVLTPGKYFTFDINRIDEVYNRFGIPVKPKKIVSSTEMAQTVRFDAGELDKGTAALGEFITGVIDEQDVKYGGNSALTLSDKKVDGREVLVKLDGKKSSELLKGLTKRYAADKALVGLTYGNAAGVSKLLDQAALFQLVEYLDKAGTLALNEPEKKLVAAVNIKNDAEAFVKDLTDAIDSFDFPQGINMKVIIDNSGNIIDRTLETSVTDIRSKNSFKLSLHSGVTSILTEDCRNRFAEITVDARDAAGKNKRGIFKLNSAFAPSGSKGDENGSIDVSWSSELDGVQQVSTDIGLELANKTDPLTLKRMDTCKYSLEMKYAGMDNANTISGSMDTESWSNKKLKTRNWSTNMTVNAAMPSFDIKNFSIALKLAKEDKLEIEVFELPDVKTSEKVNLNTATDEDLDRVWEQILASFGVFYMTNKPIIDAVLGK